MATKKPKKDTSFADLVARLNAMSNITKEEERASLMEAANQEPKILDDRDVSLADIAKLAGIKEYQDEPKVSPKAEQLVESISKEESIITKAIQESDADESISTTIKKEVTEEAKRLDKIAELEAQLAELKSQEKEEATLDADAFKETFVKEITEYVKEAEADKLAELYNAFSHNEVEVKEDSFLIKTPETQEVIADAEKAEAPEQEVVQEKEPEVEEQPADEASGYQGSAEARSHTVTLAGDFTQEEPVTEKDAESIEKMLQDAGIPAEVHASEKAFDKVDIATMADKEAVLKILDDMVEENMDIEYTDELTEAKKKPVPTSPEKWSRAKAKARSKFDVYPSAYANAYAAKEYKKMGGGWRMGKPKKKK